MVTESTPVYKRERSVDWFPESRKFQASAQSAIGVLKRVTDLAQDEPQEDTTARLICSRISSGLMQVADTRQGTTR
jgi:hypothetical protein